ncbi:hypothetical protein PVAP13_7NG003967 [Panicum virgatum]|uniref:Secreted protein n=1 Tax=Panicum virgatum TaxID=38727 RepID=A0A8T0PX27_PANVG|nr:hypothetical protein PVAP13_7NG003967 [Panicum virgatum]
MHQAMVVAVLFCIASLFPSLQSGGQLRDLRGSDFILISDKDETERPTSCNSCIHGKNKQKACYEVGEMGKHIVHGDAVGNDDDSSDDNHPESGMRVAENIKTLACNRKVKTATPYGQKIAHTAAQAGTSRCRHLPITARSEPPLPRRLGTRLFQAAHNRNRA